MLRMETYNNTGTLFKHDYSLSCHNSELSMQSNNMDSCGSMPTLDSAVTSEGDVSTSTDIELSAAAHTAANLKDLTFTTSSGVYVARKRSRWNIPQKCNCLFKRICIVYTLILTTIWILFTIPIIAFYATDASFFSDPTSSDMTFTQGVSNRQCSDDFYLENSSGLCRPECGQWDQYTSATQRAVYGTNITFILLTIFICVVTLVWSVVRHTIMLRYPNILLVYITLFRIVLSVLHVIGYTDEEALYCTSRNRATAFDESTPYCNIIGAATTFIPAFDQTALVFQLGTVLFTAYFPFRAREFELKGRYKYLHLVAIISCILFPIFLVGIQFGLGGYSRAVVPIFCLAGSSSAFVFAIIPSCVITAIFLTFVMILLFKVFDFGEWKLKPKPTKPDGDNMKSSTHRYTTAQVKLVFTFCAYGAANLINYTAYSVVLRREDAYSQALEQYFTCESTGGGDVCDRSPFEELDPTDITFPLTTISYLLLPLATLIYVADVEKLYKKFCKAKFCLP